MTSTTPKKVKNAFNPERWKGNEGLAFRPTPQFLELAAPIVASRRTLLGFDRLWVFWQAVRNVAGVPGDVAEVGVYRGGSAYFIASALTALTGAVVPFRVFDTFRGHPAQAISEHDQYQRAGQFKGTRFPEVQAYLSKFSRLEIYQGDVAASLPAVQDAAYRLVHIDTDLYAPTLVCLDYFGHRLSSGGVIVIDDYASVKCPGVPKAVAEYLERTPGFQVWDMSTQQLILTKG